MYFAEHINQIRKGGSEIFFLKLKTSCIILAVLPLIIIVRLVRPFILIRFGSLWSSRIGHYAANTELYLCMKDAELQKKRTIDIFFNEQIISNYQLKKMWERTLHVSNLASCLYKANRLIPWYQKHIIQLPFSQDINVRFEKIPAHISFIPEEEKKGLKELHKIGISEGSKFVCFIARDAAYLDITLPEGSWRYHDYRNSDVNKLINAAEELVCRGYFAIRMGAVVKEPLNSNNPCIIDYAIQHRTDFMDIYLCSKCYFFISTGVGLDVVPALFRRPVLLVNSIPLLVNLYSWGTIYLFIPKKLWQSKERRFMTFREIIESGAGRFHRTQQYEQAGIEVIENTPEEIRDVAVEMDERLKGTWQTTEEDEELQQRVWSLFRKSELHGVIKARIGRDFLRQNKDLLE